MSTQILNNRFEIEKVLSSSDFKTTYLACDRKQLHRPSCVVTAIAYRQKGMRDRLEREAKTLELLSQSPQVPRVIATFAQSFTVPAEVTRHNSQQSDSQTRHSTGDHFCIVQEHISGHPISKEITPGKKLSESYVAKLLQDTLVALLNVHRQGQVHQNLHPQHLIRQSFDGQIFLTQFGALSRLSRSEIGPEGTLQIMTPVSPHPYLAPEQLKPDYSERPLPASDLYALGLIAIEALTGQPHYDLTYDPNRGLLWREGTEVSLGLAEFIDRLVRHDATDRFTDAAAALACLRVDRNRHQVAHDSRFATVIAAPGGRAATQTTTYQRTQISPSGRSIYSGNTSSPSHHTQAAKPLNPQLFKFFAGSLAVLMALGVGVKTYQWGQQRLSDLPETWQDWRTSGGSPSGSSNNKQSDPSAKPKELTPLLQDGSILARPDAAEAFWNMYAAANAEGVELYAIGGYREPEDTSRPTEKNDYPTGYAIAIGSADESQDWQPGFAQSDAFSWLQTNAKTYGFELSISEKGFLGTTSPEPWHWTYVSKGT
ncbi:MAG: D-alanyl-D-alanine carboxypeptidase family protein [Cyanobacteria bacterium J06621_11]